METQANEELHTILVRTTDILFHVTTDNKPIDSFRETRVQVLTLWGGGCAYVHVAGLYKDCSYMCLLMLALVQACSCLPLYKPAHACPCSSLLMLYCSCLFLAMCCYHDRKRLKEAETMYVYNTYHIDVYRRVGSPSDYVPSLGRKQLTLVTICNLLTPITQTIHVYNCVV